MAGSRSFLALSATVVIIAFFVCVNASTTAHKAEELKSQSSTNSSTADKLSDGAWNDAVKNPEEVAAMVDMTIRNSTERRRLGFFSCATGNPIDDCWRCDRNWHLRRKRLANCAIGFGRNAVGGRDGRYYVVTDPSDNDAINPRLGTLRHAVIQDRPLWIVFKRDMVITLKQELIMNSFKTIDGRGVNVAIAGGACITIQYVTNIIIHGINIHDCRRTGNAMVRSSPSHYGWRTMADGDAISIFGSSHIWIDHNSLSNCADGLVDAVMGSTAITISNNYLTHHNEVMLMGHSDSYTRDKLMQVTIAYNHFGEGLIQRMPRCRHGYFHIVNNDYTHWIMYAIGGSANPTINSQGNRFLAPANPFAKEVTKRVGSWQGEWKQWNWRSQGDQLLNGAYFTKSGTAAPASYARASSLAAKPSSVVMLMGHSDSYTRDKLMQVTIAYNHFGEGLIQRMPRCRHGYFHIVNNDYTHWIMYAIGGSANPTINSQGNRFLAPTNPFAKEVTKRVGSWQGEWKQWNWRSQGDQLLNGAYFTRSGTAAPASYARASSLAAKPSSVVRMLTYSSGALKCRIGMRC